MDNTIKPTEAELEILQILWDQGPSPVRLVNEQQNIARQAAGREEAGYTTTLKLLQIMAEKGLVTRDTRTRTHVYAAAAPEEATRQQLLQKFVDTTFKGSAMKMVMQALGHHQASAEELEAIKALIEKMEREQ